MFGKSSIDWCEKNYIYSNYIAEFFNTITGLALCLSSLIFYNFYIKNVRGYNKYIYNANFWLFIVGVGTILFHGTLLYIFQLLDEVPMLLITTEYIKLNIKIGEQLNLQNNIFNHAKLFVKARFLIIPSIIYSYYIYPQLQSITFIGFFTYSVTLVFFQIKYIQENLHLKESYILNNFLKKRFTKNTTYTIEDLYIYNKITICLFISSLIIWVGDSIFCKYFEEFKLHALWHILTSIAIYSCNVLMHIHTKLATQY